MKVTIIGSGASGMPAALHAARHGADATLFEHNLITARKLLVTGNVRGLPADPGRRWSVCC